MSSNISRRLIFSSANLGLIFGILVWIALLILGSYQLRNGEGYGRYQVVFGPFELSTIARQPTDHGLVASFSLGKGLCWYLLLGFALGMLIGWTITRVREGHPDRQIRKP